MDMNNSLVVGAGALIVGIIIGYSMSGSGEELAEQGLAQTHELSAKVEQMSGALADLNTRVGGIEGAVGALATTQTTELQGLGTRIDGVGQSFASGLQELGGGVADKLRTQIDGLRGQIAGLGAAPPRHPAAPKPPRREAAAAPEATGAAPTGTALTPGRTAVLTEGKLYVFLSSADTEGARAMVAINGQRLTPLQVGEDHEIEGCTVKLNGFDADGAAMIEGSC